MIARRLLPILGILGLAMPPGLRADHAPAKSLDVPLETDAPELPQDVFKVVPGKDPGGWSFTLEPYLWAIGMKGQMGVKGNPPSAVDFTPRTILQHLDWGVFGRGEVRRGRWGLLADGFFAQLSASGSPSGGLYRSLDLTVQQGMGLLALAYRVFDKKNGFVDVYAGARYNFVGLDLSGTLDERSLQQVGDMAAERVVADARERLKTAVSAEVERRQSGRHPVLPEHLADPLREALVARARARVEPEVAKAEAAVATAKKKLAKEIAAALKDELTTESKGAQWWVDPLVGLRAQVGLTRWLFVAAQGDVGGFGASSQIAWSVQATLGVNCTRNVFAEAGYRYFFMDYDRGGAVYDAAEFGLFAGLGVKF